MRCERDHLEEIIGKLKRSRLPDVSLASLSETSIAASASLAVCGFAALLRDRYSFPCLSSSGPRASSCGESHMQPTNSRSPCTLHIDRSWSQRWRSRQAPRALGPAWWRSQAQVQEDWRRPARRRASGCPHQEQPCHLGCRACGRAVAPYDDRAKGVLLLGGHFFVVNVPQARVIERGIRDSPTSLASSVKHEWKEAASGRASGLPSPARRSWRRTAKRR